MFRSGFLLFVAVAPFLHHNGAADAFSVSPVTRSRFRPVETRTTLSSNYMDRDDMPPDDLGPADAYIGPGRRSRRGGYMNRFRGGYMDEDNQLRREMVAEMIGTAIIVGLGTGAVMSAVFDGALNGLFQVAAVWAFAVTIAISTTSSASGAHLNPAISFALAWFRPSRNYGWYKFFPYCLAQVAGGVLGSWANYILFASKIRDFESMNSIMRGGRSSIESAKAFGQYFVKPITWPTALIAEAFGTAVLTFVCFALTNENSDATKNALFIPPIIGITVGALICVLAPLTQAGFNPARDFGPRIVAWFAGWGDIAWRGWWVYVLGPLIGAPIGAYVADRFLLPDDEY